MRTTPNQRSPILAERAATSALERYLEARATGRRLGWSREAAGVTQQELAGYLGVSATTIRRIEHGQRTITPAERVTITRALGCSIATLTASSSNGHGRAA